MAKAYKTVHLINEHRPWREEINLQTSSTLHWAGVAERKLPPSIWRLQRVGLSDGGALCPAFEQECEELGDSEGESSSSSSPSLDTSSERLDSEWHYAQKSGDSDTKSNNKTSETKLHNVTTWYIKHQAGIFQYISYSKQISWRGQNQPIVSPTLNTFWFLYCLWH